MYYGYYGTIGNSNCAVGCLSLSVTYLVFRFLSCEEKQERYMFLFHLIIGLFSCFLIGTDGIYPVFAFCSLFMVPFLLMNPHERRREAQEDDGQVICHECFRKAEGNDRKPNLSENDIFKTAL